MLSHNIWQEIKVNSNISTESIDGDTILSTDSIVKYSINLVLKFLKLKEAFAVAIPVAIALDYTLGYYRNPAHHWSSIINIKHRPYCSLFCQLFCFTFGPISGWLGNAFLFHAFCIIFSKHNDNNKIDNNTKSSLLGCKFHSGNHRIITENNWTFLQKSSSKSKEIENRRENRWLRVTLSFKLRVRFIKLGHSMHI